MKLILKSLAAGLFAFSMANAQDDVPADAALAPASDKPTMARSELPVGADISNRYLERVFYHWKDNKEKGIIKVFVHTDELAEEREPDELNYDVLYRDADNNVIFWKDHVAKCVKCFGKPVVDGPTPNTPKALVYDWDPKKIDDTTKTMVEGELPAEVYMITKDNDIRNLKSRWIGPSDKTTRTLLRWLSFTRRVASSSMCRKDTAISTRAFTRASLSRKSSTKLK